MQPPPSDVEILAELLETEDVSDDYYYSGEVADVPVKWPDENELLQVIRGVPYFSTTGTQSNLTLVALKVKSISTLLRRSKRP